MRHALSVAYDLMAERGDIAPDPAQRAVLDHLEDLRVALESRVERGGILRRLLSARRRTMPRGLYIWGAVGRGKSMLMDLFFRSARVPSKRRVHFHAFMQEIHARLRDRRAGGVADPLAVVAAETARGLDLLCFDEMQITDIADAMLVGRLFEGLFAAGVAVVVTSNRPPEDLYKDGLNRDLFLPFIDLLRTRLTVLCLDSERDFRLGRDVSRQCYFHPLDDAARAGIEAAWRELVSGPPAPLQLEVPGRRIALPAVSGRVARARFADLCERPLGPADYLLLAERFSTLVLTDVPRMDRSRNNEAKRFITLIDTLYEARRCLVVSAEAAPEDLYREGPNAFEFARTASRLREMQSKGWQQACGEVA